MMVSSAASRSSSAGGSVAARLSRDLRDLQLLRRPRVESGLSVVLDKRGESSDFNPVAHCDTAFFEFPPSEPIDYRPRAGVAVP